MHIQDIVTFYIMELLVLLLIFYSSFTCCAAQMRMTMMQGNNAGGGQFPFYAQISIEFFGSRGRCGAAIIHERWLLSAAHCFADQERILNISVAVGTNKNFEVNGEEYLVEKVVKHDNFFIDSRGIPHDDIALIRLKSDIGFSINVQLIRVPKNNSVKFDGAPVTIPGMGVTSTSREGDSGGPVVTQGLIIGIVSYGYPQCIPVSPDVHTRVSTYLDWIENTMNSYSDLLP